MSLTKFIVNVFGYLFIGTIGLLLTIIILSLSIGFLTQYGVRLPNVEPFISMQKKYYFGSRNIWQYQNDCVENNDLTIYQPRFGVCEFENIEFKTRLTFSSNGRENNFDFNSERPAIAVLGDSHAMGWGVNDNETFGAQLQNLTNRQVYNLAVSSYATERALDRFSALGKGKNIDTIIIQYCDNDLNENLSYPIDRNIAKDRYIESVNLYPSLQKNAMTGKFFKAFKAFFPEKLKYWIKIIIGRNVEKVEYQHRKGIEDLLIQYAELLSDKHVVIFFVSGQNQFQPTSNWEGSFRAEGLNVDFVTLEIKDDFFYILDDHLNVHGHASIARQLSDLVK